MTARPPVRFLRSPAPWLLPLAWVACTHSEPFETAPPDPLGPPSTEAMRQLTFNTGDDRMPSVWGDLLLYSRREPGAGPPAPCIAILPADGGTLRDTFCPPAPAAADTFVSSWVEPVLSPDGARMAYVWRRSGATSIGAWSYHLVVADTGNPRVPIVSTLLTRILSGDRRAASAAELVWTTPGTIRFLAGYDSTFMILRPTPTRRADTVPVRFALMELALPSGDITLVPGGDSVVAWAPAADGGAWIAPTEHPAALVRLLADGTRTTVATWPVPVTDLAVSDAVVLAAAGRDSLYWIDPASGVQGRTALPGVAWRLAPRGTGALVIEIERRAGDAYGAPANLWLVPLPDAVTR